MSSKAMSLKGRIKNYAKSNNIAAQVVLQNYMFERFLERLSISEYSEKFVVKGGTIMPISVLRPIDVSTGDIITPEAVKYEFGGIFDKDIKITLWGYNIETVMAEKVETILSRGIFTTRPRDFYDVYILGTTQEYNREIFKKALKATAIHRGSLEKIADVNGIIEQISSSTDLNSMWAKYQKKFSYAKDITYENVIEVLKAIVKEKTI